jgi:hypothetical protein
VRCNFDGGRWIRAIERDGSSCCVPRFRHGFPATFRPVILPSQQTTCHRFSSCYPSMRRLAARRASLVALSTIERYLELLLSVQHGKFASLCRIRHATACFLLSISYLGLPIVSKHNARPSLFVAKATAGFVAHRAMRTIIDFWTSRSKLARVAKCMNC